MERLEDGSAVPRERILHAVAREGVEFVRIADALEVRRSPIPRLTVTESRGHGQQRQHGGVQVAAEHILVHAALVARDAFSTHGWSGASVLVALLSSRPSSSSAGASRPARIRSALASWALTVARYASRPVKDDGVIDAPFQCIV